MKAFEIQSILNRIAPPELAYAGEEIGYIAGDPDKDVIKVAVTWRPTLSVLEECQDKRIDLLINHEPMLESRKSHVVPTEELSFSPITQREKLIAEMELVVLRCHSQWDDAVGGNNDTLANILDINITDKIPFGRIGDVETQTLENFTDVVKNKLCCPNLLVVGDVKREIKKSCSGCW